MTSQWLQSRDDATTYWVGTYHSGNPKDVDVASNSLLL